MNLCILCLATGSIWNKYCVCFYTHTTGYKCTYLVLLVWLWNAGGHVKNISLSIEYSMSLSLWYSTTWCGRVCLSTCTIASSDNNLGDLVAFNYGTHVSLHWAVIIIWTLPVKNLPKMEHAQLTTGVHLSVSCMSYVIPVQISHIL